jgi:flagellar basal body rod protein FlgG
MSSGSQYIALSGLRARVDALDRLATDIANVGTAGYKGERDTTTAAERFSFDRSLQSAIDTGARRPADRHDRRRDRDDRAAARRGASTGKGSLSSTRRRASGTRATATSRSTRTASS